MLSLKGGLEGISDAVSVLVLAERVEILKIENTSLINSNIKLKTELHNNLVKLNKIISENECLEESLKSKNERFFHFTEFVKSCTEKAYNLDRDKDIIIKTLKKENEELKTKINV